MAGAKTIRMANGDEVVQIPLKDYVDSKLLENINAQNKRIDARFDELNNATANLEKRMDEGFDHIGKRVDDSINYFDRSQKTSLAIYGAITGTAIALAIAVSAWIMHNTEKNTERYINNAKQEMKLTKEEIKLQRVYFKEQTNQTNKQIELLDAKLEFYKNKEK